MHVICYISFGQKIFAFLVLGGLNFFSALAWRVRESSAVERSRRGESQRRALAESVFLMEAV